MCLSETRSFKADVSKIVDSGAERERESLIVGPRGPVSRAIPKLRPNFHVANLVSLSGHFYDNALSLTSFAKGLKLKAFKALLSPR